MSALSEVLPQIPLADKAKSTLSPFHWNNLTLPVLSKGVQSAINQNGKEESLTHKNKGYRSTQKHLRSSPKQGILSPILEKQSKEARIKKDPKGRRTASKSHQQDLMLEQFKSMNLSKDKQRRYSFKDRQITSTSKTMNKSIEMKNSLDSSTKKASVPPATSEGPGKKIKYLNAKNNMEHYLKMNLTKAGWEQRKDCRNKDAQILWSNDDRPTDYGDIRPGQFYNHIKGSSHLTNKGQLHEHLQAMGLKNYPTSFLVPKQYEQFMAENNTIAVKKMLRCISSNIVDHFQRENVKREDLLGYEVSLGQILTSTILQTGNEQTKMLIKLCMYLEVQRLEHKYCKYFQNFKKYTKVNVKPKPHLFDSLIENAASCLDGDSHAYINYNYGNLDYRLLMLILHYDRLFNDKEANYSSSEALWIIKPIASSRGAGISIIKSSSQFCSRGSAGWCEFKNRKKYQNKIMQKYISNPYILQHSGQYSGRKFDIRQWVLVISHQDKASVFKYHTAYCRFASQPFTLSKLNRQVHLTNYSLLKQQANSSQPSVMMLEQFFSCTRQDLRGKYVQQSTQIIQDVVKNCHNLQYQDGCFELFGFDFLFDSQGKLHLLEINLNPACASSRHQPLRIQTEAMAQTMLSLVTQRKFTIKWQQILGPTYSSKDDDSDIIRSSEIEVKPFYKDILGEEESLIALIRHRKRVIYRLGEIVKKYWLRRMVDDSMVTKSKQEHEAEQKSAEEQPNPQKAVQCARPESPEKSQQSKGSLISPFWPN